MKIINKYINYFSLALVMLFMASCSEEAPIPSQITYYPTFDITGGQYIMVETGSTFTDPGVIANVGDGTVPVVTSGTVNTDEAGLYTLYYSATNADGFEASSFRYVIVVDDPAAIAANDLSGTYSVGTRSATLTKVSDGVYEADDILPPNRIRALIFQISDTELIVPVQSSPFGPVYADPSIDPNSGGELNGSDFTLKTSVGSFGIFTRTFLKN
ncbi:DUF5011 domain-containing protein [Flavobacteriaceae bacterium XHP0103]|uniref:DUF5011 domain-containing protein n=1 Tax=Marixanthotalea marina TaxID=2844359 RepID=UPI00298A02E6|nr:DUF5011 domain-containing protein [Marixanthotalea marina]MBU3821875.1 DUF5011 domain-containing protein [Marixanthotalea marina]